ncbi:glycosyltransferase family protein [Paracoccus sp. KR1-242]|uniref:glycosyltransferase family protein n=1 Tax=Paracoccus sp. KR1-242 TaxID=3410028 RepID=UPI003C065ABB
MRVMFYVQHLLGIGHLARASRIAEALAADGAQVTVVTGGLPVPGFPAPGIAHLALPAMAVGQEGFGDLVDAEGRAVDDTFREHRRALLLDAFAALDPDVLLIEAFPFGRRQVRFELLPLIRVARDRANPPLILSSVRDILQANRKPGRDEETVAALADFDAVLVHGDPAFSRIEESFPLAARIAPKLRYTGLVTPPPPAATDERHDIVLSAGGGAVGADLIRCAMQARALLPLDLNWCVLTGPNLPQPEFEAFSALASDRLAVHRFRANLAGLMASARVSVSQAGYNTVGDVLRAGCEAVLVPFASGGETEQTLRAEKLAARGLALVLPERGLTAEALADAIRIALGRSGRARPALDLDGANTSARILREMQQARISGSIRSGAPTHPVP